MHKIFFIFVKKIFVIIFLYQIQEKLEKSVEKLKAREDFYDTFICRMHKWLVDKASLAIEMFKNIDSDEGLLSYDEFKAGKIKKFSNKL